MNHSLQQPIVPTRTDLVLHVVFFLMAVVVIGLSFMMRSGANHFVFLPGMDSPLPSMCSTKVMFGVNCPGCGLTRSFIAISDGRWSDAWQLNRASFVVYLFVFAQIPWHGMQLWRLWKGRRPVDYAIVYFVPVMLAAVLTINWLIYLCGV